MSDTSVRWESQLKWNESLDIYIIFQTAVWGGEQQLHHLGLDVSPQSAVQEVEEGEREAEHGAGHDEVHTQGAVGSREQEFDNIG